MRALRITAADRVAGLRDQLNNHFAAVGASLLVLAVAGFVAVAHLLVAAQLRSAEEHAATSVGVVLARSAFGSAIGADSGPLSASEITRLDAAASGAKTTQTILGLALLAPDGTVLYSSSRSLIGTREMLDPYARAALAGNITTTPREVGTEPPVPGKVARIDVFVPLADTRARVVGLFELSFPYAPIASQVAIDARRVDVVLLASGLLIFLVLGLRLRPAGTAMRAVTVQQHGALVRELRRAIRDGEFRLEYQPLAHLRSGRVRAVEALVRWEHPQRGLVAPGQFIPQAERTPVIWPLTEHILRLAVQQAAQWRENGLDLRVSVNIPAPCLLDSRLSGVLAELLDGAQLPPDRLAIELTEESLIREPRAAREAVLKLRSLGIALVALDDFGTGYSSLTRLHDLPITGLKIDRSFIVNEGIDGDPRLIAAIADLAHRFELAVVAEGIEDEATWKRMAALGCDVGQGYWLSRPLRAEAVHDWMRGRIVEAWPQAPAAADLPRAVRGLSRGARRLSASAPRR